MTRPNRPYCMQELTDLDLNIQRKFSLSDIFITHHKCLHRYRIKKGSKKEQELLFQNEKTEQNEQNEKNEHIVWDNRTCSVCYKIRTSFEPIPNIEVVAKYDGKFIDRELIKNKHEFYRWLFQHDCW